MARRGGGMAPVVGCCCFLVALALACGSTVAASAAPPKKLPRMSVPANGRPAHLPPKTKFQTITFNKFSSKRQYVITCSDDGSAPCIVSCPSRCPNKCLASCSYCRTFCMCDIFPGTSCGDPRFTGGDGNTFYFHGKKDQDFCIVSDTDLHINAHFIGNHNPAVNRNFTWVQAIGVTFGDQKLYIGARKAMEWDEDEDHIHVALDGKTVHLDTAKNVRWESKSATLAGRLSVTRTDDVNTITAELDGVFSISANAVPITDEDSRVHNYGKTGSDSLVHLDLGFRFHSLTDGVDGVLGQTYRPDYVNGLDISAKMPIMGGAPKYLSSGLFSTDCAVSRFRRNVAGGRAVTFAS